MKNTASVLAIALFGAAAATAAETQDVADGAGAAQLPVSPQPYYGRVAQRLMNLLEDCHVLRQPFDESMSRRAWTNVVTFYDFDRSIFLKSDLEALAAHETTIGEELRNGDVGFAFEVFALYSRRLRERVEFATNTLACAEWDFSKDEKYMLKRKTAEWPGTKEEAEDRWRKRLKYEMLGIIANRELDAEERAAAETDGAAEEADGAEAAQAPAVVQETGSAEAAAGVADDGEDDKSKTPEANLLKKYRQYVNILTAPDEESVMQSYMSAVCRAYDPHTDYFSPAGKEEFDMEMSLSLCGIGATLSLDEGALKIEEIMPGSPVDRDGRIEEGDRIVGVGQGTNEVEDITWQPMKKSIRKIRGPKGTRVTLEIVPRSDASGTVRRRYELVRDEIKLEDLAVTGRVEVLERENSTNRLGYVYVPAFYGTPELRPGSEGYSSCTADVARYLADFNAMDVGGVILDMRGNGGGNLIEAIMLSGRFVPSGPVVQVRDSIVRPHFIPAGNIASCRKPLVVLVDHASASASEIVAAHLQDTGRAVIVGDSQTHGKGTVQTLLGLGPKEYGSAKVTTARFYRVDGRSTQVRGVSPDLHLPSVLDSLDIGEDKLDGALPFTKILRAGYSKCWNMDRYVGELARLSSERLSADERWGRHLASVEGMKKIFDREEVPLEKEAFLAVARADRAVREDGDGGRRLNSGSGEGKGRRERRRRRRGVPDGDDVVLDEAFEILGDLVDAVGGEELPRPKPSAMDWYNAVFGF